MVSLIVPCFNEQEVLPIFYDKINEVSIIMEQKYNVSTEFIFVDDGSSDNTLSVIKSLKNKDSRVYYISFSRNFGKEAAIYSGLAHAKGDQVAVLDADLQDPPELLVEMYRCITEEGFDSVAARRTTRNGEPPIRSLFANMYYWIIQRLSNVEMVSGARDFRLMTRAMVDSILSLKEYNRYSKGIFAWVGFRTKWLTYDNVERAAGKTKWSFWALFKYSLEGIFNFSHALLSFVSFIGLLLCLLSIIIMAIIIAKTLVLGESLAGYPLLICIICFIGGIQLLCLSILSQYISRMYLEAKHRPIYVIKEKE